MAAVMTPFLDSDIRLTPPRAGQQASLSQGKDGLVEERLPFTVRLVSSERQLAKAIAIRHAAYARHLPEFAESLKQAERSDFSDDSVILLAESRLDGSPLGTMRIQTNRHEPLPLEQSVALPEWLRQQPAAEAARLGVARGPVGHLVKTVLFKAFYQYCLQEGLAWMVIAGRSPIDRQYERLLFDEVFPGQGYVPLRHVNNVLHRVMCFEVGTANARWAAVQHPLHHFMVKTHHPDICLDTEPLKDFPYLSRGLPRFNAVAGNGLCATQ